MPIDYYNSVYSRSHHISEIENLQDCIPAFLVVVQFCKMIIETENHQKSKIKDNVVYSVALQGRRVQRRSPCSHFFFTWHTLKPLNYKSRKSCFQFSPHIHSYWPIQFLSKRNIEKWTSFSLAFSTYKFTLPIYLPSRMYFLTQNLANEKLALEGHGISRHPTKLLNVRPATAKSRNLFLVLIRAQHWP